MFLLSNLYLYFIVIVRIQPLLPCRINVFNFVDLSLLLYDSWWRGTVVERRSLTGELSLSCARPAADG